MKPKFLVFRRGDILWFTEPEMDFLNQLKRISKFSFLTVFQLTESNVIEYYLKFPIGFGTLVDEDSNLSAFDPILITIINSFKHENPEIPS